MKFLSLHKHSQGSSQILWSLDTLFSLSLTLTCSNSLSCTYITHTRGGSHTLVYLLPTHSYFPSQCTYLNTHSHSVLNHTPGYTCTQKLALIDSLTPRHSLSLIYSDTQSLSLSLIHSDTLSPSPSLSLSLSLCRIYTLIHHHVANAFCKLHSFSLSLFLSFSLSFFLSIYLFLTDFFTCRTLSRRAKNCVSGFF